LPLFHQIFSKLPPSSRAPAPQPGKSSSNFLRVPIRNANTRAAYHRAIQQFLSWCERAGYRDLEDIEPITVAAYIEILQRQAAPPTVKQHMAAIRMLFSWLTEKGVLAMNPAREVKTERFSRTEGKTPAFAASDSAQASEDSSLPPFGVEEWS
jgi:site-specific recombinase XerD